MDNRTATAQWEDPAAAARKYHWGPGRFWLGRGVQETPIGYLDDRHICLVSGTRGGKGASIIVNNLCYWSGSVVVIDPKGENATITAARRGAGDQYCEGMGQAVHVLDPFNTAHVEDRYRSHFNPLDTLDPKSEATVDDVNRLVTALVVINDAKADPFWDEMARSMLRAVILHVVTAGKEIDPSERTLFKVRELLKRGNWELKRDMEELAEPDDEPIDTAQVLLWRTLEANPAFDGLVAGDGARFLGLLLSSPKQYESVLQTALVSTDFLDSPGMRRVLGTSDFRLSDLKTAPGGLTLYLSLPQENMETHYRWLRLMVTLIMTEMARIRGQPATGHRILIVLDEFAGLERMKIIETSVSQIAGFGVKLFFVLQSLEQLTRVYKDNWETFLANAGLKIFFSIEDNFTREYVSKQVGQAEIILDVLSSNQGQSENDSEATGWSRSTGTSNSTTDGTSQSQTLGTSATDTMGRSHSDTRSQSSGTTRGGSASTSSSTSESENRGSSSSETTQYKDVFDYMVGTILPFTVSRSHSFGGSYGTSTSNTFGRSSGESWGSSDGTSQGTSDGESTSQAQGRSSSSTGGSSQSRTQGTSTTDGTSGTTTRATGRTRSSGWSQSIQQRPLIRPEEFGKAFARIDDPREPAYPGFALALIAGRDPVLVHRRNYFEDLQFIECFSPHPDHKFLLPKVASVSDAGPIIRELEAFADQGRRLFISTLQAWKGQIVLGAQALAAIEGVPPDWRTVHFLAPVRGKLTYVGVSPQTTGEQPSGRIPEGVLFTIKYYGPAGPQVDPFLELKAARRLALQSPEPGASEIGHGTPGTYKSGGDGETSGGNPVWDFLTLAVVVLVLGGLGFLLWRLAHTDLVAGIVSMIAGHAFLFEIAGGVIGLVILVGGVFIVSSDFLYDRFDMDIGGQFKAAVIVIAVIIVLAVIGFLYFHSGAHTTYSHYS